MTTSLWLRVPACYPAAASSPTCIDGCRSRARAERGPGVGCAGSTLLAARRAAEDVHLVGVDLSERAVSRTGMRLDLHGLDARIEKRDAFDEYGSGFADSLLLQPPCGLQLNERQKSRLAELT